VSGSRKKSKPYSSFNYVNEEFPGECRVYDSLMGAEVGKHTKQTSGAIYGAQRLFSRVISSLPTLPPPASSQVWQPRIGMFESLAVYLCGPLVVLRPIYPVMEEPVILPLSVTATGILLSKRLLQSIVTA
jgi:VIT1/CCC1 family predicted Fe2+/Mn2+ transporter